MNPAPDDEADAIGKRAARERLAAALLPLTNDDCKRLVAALDPLESERRVAEWQRTIDEAKSDELLSSAQLAERHREWKAAHPGFDPMFEAVRTDAAGRNAR